MSRRNLKMTKISRQIQVSVLLPLQKFLVGLPPRLSIGHERSVRAKRNILALLVLKGFSVITNFLIVSITLDYLKPVKYGVWLTISSIVSWFTFFDIGLGNGLRNKFAEALATNRADLARTYVSTSYAILFLILMVSSLVFLSFSSMIQWTDALNAPTEMEGELTILLMIVVCLFCVRLLFVCRSKTGFKFSHRCGRELFCAGTHICFDQNNQWFIDVAWSHDECDIGYCTSTIHDLLLPYQL